MPPRQRLSARRISAVSSAVAERFSKDRVVSKNFKPIGLDALDPVLKTRIGHAGIDIAPVVAEINRKLKMKAARQKIQEYWENSGGPASELGLPLDHFTPQEVGGGYLVPFRGGNIKIDGDLKILEKDLGPPCRVTFEGLILHSRQETSPDEIYGEGAFQVGSILMGNKVLSGTFLIPEVQLGGKDNRNTRVWHSGAEIYRGPPAGMQVVVAIREHDHGDREEVRNKVRSLINDSSKDIASELSKLGGDSAQKGMAGEQIASSEWGDFLRDAAADLITDLFGLSDDLYNPGGVNISDVEMATPPVVLTAGHSLDNKTLSYTHKIDMSGIDDDGAVGNCSAYFRVWR